MDATNQQVHHAPSRYNGELEILRKQLLEMGGILERQVVDASAALVTGNSALAETVIEREKNVNAAEIEVDKRCTNILSNQGLESRELRLLLSIYRITTDLERIGDEANKIAKMALKLAEQGKAPKGYPEVKHISQLVISMLANVLNAYMRLDIDLAIDVAKKDDMVDLAYKSAMRALIRHMREEPENIQATLNMMWSLRSLERIGDHIKNLSEQIIYMVKGYDVRHLEIEEIEEKLSR